MSLWTPSGEHRVPGDRGTQSTTGATRGRPPVSGDEPDGPSASGGPGSPGGPGSTDAGRGAPDDDPAVDELRQQLSDTPAEVVVANHCYGLFELAAVYLSASPPRLDQARLAIDALGSLVEGLGQRLGDPHKSLRDALAQIRLAYVQIATVHERPGTGGDAGRDAGRDAGTPDGTAAGSSGSGPESEAEA